MTGKRAHTKKEVETDVLTLSGRRCCLCFGIKGDLEVKQGQIAHVDQKRDNNNLDNLAWLCLNHHDSYDSKTSQSKGYTLHELKHYRVRLYNKMKEMRDTLIDEKSELLEFTSQKEAREVLGEGKEFYYAQANLDGVPSPGGKTIHRT